MSFKTQAEIFQALLDGKKLMYIGVSKYYVHFKNGTIVDATGDYMPYNFASPKDWSIYEEPKPKKQVWQWRFIDRDKYLRVSELLLTEDEAACEFGDLKYEKHAGPFEVED